MGNFDLNRRKVIFYTLWIVIHVGVFIYGYQKQKNDPELFLLNSIGVSVFISRGAGLVLAMDCALLILPVCRNLIKILRGIRWLNHVIPFDDNIYFHKCTAYAMLFFTLVHVNAHYVNFFRVETVLHLLENWQVHYTTWAGITGHLMLFIMFLMYTSAKIEVRHKKFEIFWFTHHLSIPFYLLLFFHGYGCFVKSSIDGKCKGYNSNYATVPVFLLYLLERLIRVYRGSQPTNLKKVIIHPGKTIEIQFEKPSFQYKCGQYLYLNIPQISKFEWHPFTITSTPEEGFISLHMRIAGDWTSEAAKILGCYSKELTPNDSIDLPALKIDGPFGAPAEDFYNFETVILVGAGIGVTPAASLLKSLWYKFYRKAPMTLKKVYFFWINRDREAFQWFQSLLSTLESSVPDSFLEIHVYFTAKLTVEDIQGIAIHSASSTADPITELQTKSHFGRPDWDNIFRLVRNGCVERSTPGYFKKEVGVFYCGPAPLADTLKEATEKATSSDIRFTFKKEKF